MSRVSHGSRPAGLNAITVDLDGAWCYRAIHGEETSPPDDDDGDPLLLAALPALLDLAADLDLQLTLFVVTRDLRSPAIIDLLRDAHARGHSLQSHSHHHRYDLARHAAADIVADLEESRHRLGEVTGAPPSGFRAPGYTQSATLRRAVCDAGFSWSSSVLPSPAYFAVRQAVRLATRVRTGSPSASQRGSLRDFSPLYRRGPVREVPITTALGQPWIGTTVCALPDIVGDALTALALRTTDAASLVFELHAADVVDGALLPVGQPDREVPLIDKQRRLRRCLQAIRAHLGGDH